MTEFAISAKKVWALKSNSTGEVLLCPGAREVCDAQCALTPPCPLRAVPSDFVSAVPWTRAICATSHITLLACSSVLCCAWFCSLLAPQRPPALPRDSHVARSIVHCSMDGLARAGEGWMASLRMPSAQPPSETVSVPPISHRPSWHPGCNCCS